MGLKLHLGCGGIIFDGWKNIDVLPPADVRHDLTTGIPFSDGSVDFIYSEHFFEHLLPDAGGTLMRECRRVLVSGGTMRVAMPSLSYVVKKYLSTEWRDQDWLKRPEHGFIRTPAEMLNIGLRWWGHQWMYDEEELETRLRDAGFTQFVRREFGESDHPELRGRETRLDSMLIYDVTR